MAVGAAGLELIAQSGLVDQNIHGNGNDDGNEDAAVDLGAGEQLVQPQLRSRHAVEGSLINIPGLGIFHHVFEIAHVKGPGHDVRRQPVGHDAGQNLVDIQKGLQHAGDGAPQRAGQAAAQESDHPDETSRHRLRRNSQSQHERCHGAHQILSRRADVEQARLVGHSYGKAGHNQRRRPEQHVAQRLGVIAPGQVARRVPAGGQNAREDQPHTIPNALGGDGVLAQTHQHHHNGAHKQAHQNGDQRRQHLFGGILFIDGS